VSTEPAPTSQPTTLVQDGRLVLEEYYDQIVDFLNKLFNLSARVQNASRKFRAKRAVGHVERDADGTDVLIEFKHMVRLKIAGLHKLTEPWLVDRLADAVTKRRQLFYYQKAHASRRGKLHEVVSVSTATQGEEVATEDIVTAPINPTAETKLSSIQATSREATRHPELEKDTKTQVSMETHTTATQLNIESDQWLESGTAKPTQTELRIDESIFPPLPPKGRYGTFQCTQCFETLSEAVRKAHLWK
jgi:hypothetical protein